MNSDPGPLKLEVRHLRLVLAIAEEKTVTRAGERLHLTQSALSHQLRDIEDRLGLDLFHRTGRRLVLTDAGKRVLEASRGILSDLGELEQELAQFAQSRRGTVRLSTECYTCYHWLPRVLTRFRASHDGIDVRIVPEATRKPIEALRDGILDVAIITGEPTEIGLESTVLFRDELVLVVSPTHRLARRKRIMPADLESEHLILYCSPEESSFYNEYLAVSGVTPKAISEIQLTEAIVSMVKEGLGVAALARWAVAPEVSEGKVVAIPFSGSFAREWRAAYRSRGRVPAHVKAFVDALAGDPLRSEFPAPIRRSS